MSDRYLINILDEQVSVGFTGKINVLNAKSKQHLGVITLYEGEVFHASFKGSNHLKAFYSLFIKEMDSDELTYVVEPEIVDEFTRSIHYPYNVLKQKVSEVISEYQLSKENRPPDHLKLMAKPDFIKSGDTVSPTEFKLLTTLSDYNQVADIYKNCDLLDYEITNALVSLRKKNGLVVIKPKPSK